MSIFKLQSKLLIKDMVQRSISKTWTHKTNTQKYEETFTGNITTPKEVMGRIEKILERDCINRKETEYVVTVWDPKEGENSSMVRYYKESYLARYARLLS